jgi:hypothetical protein
VRRTLVRLLLLLVQQCSTSCQSAFGTPMRPEPAPGSVNEGSRQITVPECRTWRCWRWGPGPAARGGIDQAWRGRRGSISPAAAISIDPIYIRFFFFFFFHNFFIYLRSGSCRNGSAEVAQVAPMGAHAAVRMPGGLAYPCRGVGVPKYR